MARLWINNLSPAVNDEELRSFLQRYGFPEPDALTDVAGEDGQRRAVVATYADVDEHALRQLQPRIHGVFFKDRTLHVQVAPPQRSEPW